MKQSMSNRILSLCSAALFLLPALSACSRNPSPSAEAPAPEHALSDTILLGGRSTAVFLDVSNEEILFRDQASGGNLLAAAKYPEEIPGAAEALDGCDFTDLDLDGNSDLTASFRLEDGTSASLVWFFSDGGFVYNEEFSRLPGDALPGE